VFERGFPWRFEFRLAPLGEHKRGSKIRGKICSQRVEGLW